MDLIDSRGRTVVLLMLIHEHGMHVVSASYRPAINDRSG